MNAPRAAGECHHGGGESRKPPHRPLPDKPQLRLQGRWLDEAGFAIGMRVGVQVAPGRLVLEVLGPKYTRESDVRHGRRSREN